MKGITFFVLFINTIASGQIRIKEYSQYTGIGFNYKANYCIIRKFKVAKSTFFLCVDPDLLSTSIIDSSSLIFRKIPLGNIKMELNYSVYIKAIEMSGSQYTLLQNAGLYAVSDPRNYVLSTDLCPSDKPLDYGLYKALISDSTLPHPVPVCICVSGKWMLEHIHDLNWLKQRNEENELSIIWVNHSYSHPYKNELPLKKDFLLMRGINLEYEILQNEKLMIENGLIPSIFFRFPGLVSDAEIYNFVLSCGLIPLSSNAWIAKGKMPKPGSIVLLHGNCNEPYGIKEFMIFLRKEQKLPGNEEMRIADLQQDLIMMLK